MGKEGTRCSFDVLSSNSAPPASSQMGVESQCPEWQESVLAGTGAAFRLEGTTPLPVRTFKIIYCCYFFSPLTLGQKAPRLCPPSILLVALGMRTDTPTSGWAALSSPCYIPRPWSWAAPAPFPHIYSLIKTQPWHCYGLQRVSVSPSPLSGCRGDFHQYPCPMSSSPGH